MYFHSKSSKTHTRGGSTASNGLQNKRSIEQSVEKGSLRKGIERVNLENSKRFDDYGIWVASKVVSHIAGTPQASGAKKKSGSLQRPHLSLTSSFASKELRQVESVITPSFQLEFTRETSSFFFTAKTSTSEKEKRCKKISTVKSLSSKQGLNNSKYL